MLFIWRKIRFVLWIVIVCTFIYLGVSSMYKKFKEDEIKEVKDQVIEEIVVNPYKSRVEIKTLKKVYKKVLPPEAKVIIADKKTKNIIKKVIYKELLSKEQKKSIRVKRMGFYLQPKVCAIVSTEGTNIGGGVRFFWWGFYGLDFGITERNLYYGIDRRLGDLHYKLKNIVIGGVKTKDGIAISLGILF